MASTKSAKRRRREKRYRAKDVVRRGSDSAGRRKYRRVIARGGGAE